MKRQWGQNYSSVKMQNRIQSADIVTVRANEVRIFTEAFFKVCSIHSAIRVNGCSVG